MYQSISAAEFYQKAKKEELLVLDVREKEEFVWGHISSAISFPLSTLETKMPQLTKKPIYYIICQSGARSAAACTVLSDAGFNVVNVMGGMSTWPGALS